MYFKELLEGTYSEAPELMKKIVSANDGTLTACINDIKRSKAIINFHTSVYVFQQRDQYNAAQLTAALVDLHSACEMIINKINELK